MIFDDRYNECQRCDRSDTCKYKEIYYKNKGEWPIEGMYVVVNGSHRCKYAAGGR